MAYIALAHQAVMDAWDPLRKVGWSRIKHTNLQNCRCGHPGKINLIQKHPGCKKGAAKNLKKGRDEKELKSKWAAKAGVVLVLMRIKF